MIVLEAFGASATEDAIIIEPFQQVRNRSSRYGERGVNRSANR